MEYEDFAAQFRQRTAKRLMEFEKTLEQAEQRMQAAAGVAATGGAAQEKPRQRAGHGAGARVRPAGPVKSVLRRAGY